MNPLRVHCVQHRQVKERAAGCEKNLHRKHIRIIQHPKYHKTCITKPSQSRKYCDRKCEMDDLLARKFELEAHTKKAVEKLAGRRQNANDKSGVAH
jgi:hypothetical protein